MIAKQKDEMGMFGTIAALVNLLINSNILFAFQTFYLFFDQ